MPNKSRESSPPQASGPASSLDSTDIFWGNNSCGEGALHSLCHPYQLLTNCHRRVGDAKNRSFLENTGVFILSVFHHNIGKFPLEKGPIIPDFTTITVSINNQPTAMKEQKIPEILEIADQLTPSVLLSDQTPKPPPGKTAPIEVQSATNAICRPTTMDEKGAQVAPEIAELLKTEIPPLVQTPPSSSRETCSTEKGSVTPRGGRPTAKEKKRQKSSRLVTASKPPQVLPSQIQRTPSVGKGHIEKRRYKIVKRLPTSDTSTKKQSITPVQKKTHGQGKKFKSKRTDPLKGQKVIARSEENGFYFPGTVIRCIGPTHALVQFKYGDTRIVPIVFITPVGGAMPCPTLQVGDYVFAKILIPKGCHFYVPAIIIATPSREEPCDKFYTVLKCNNRRDFCLRSGLIKISQNKYALSCSFIRTTPMKEPPRMNTEDLRSDFMVFPFDEENETDLLKDSVDETSKKSKSRKKSEMKKQPEDIFSSDSEDSIFGFDTAMYCSKPKDQTKKEWFSDDVSKENSDKCTKYYAQWVNTYPKCQCYTRTFNIKKQYF
uniref:von Willebrand factor A domain containing 3B n=1 Tax=Monodelphis domestica TaxID=13616 RepID=A0A5F8G363_MONDO